MYLRRASGNTARNDEMRSDMGTPQVNFRSNIEQRGEAVFV